MIGFDPGKANVALEYVPQRQSFPFSPRLYSGIRGFEGMRANPVIAYHHQRQKGEKLQV
ncbi:hypothetical protein ACX8XP_00845 [Calditrichota bacterium LG25]